MDHSHVPSAKDLAIRAAREAGALMREGLTRELSIGHKGAVDLVTEIDTGCEQLVVNSIRQAFPFHHIVAEEGSLHHPEEEQPSPLTWVIDPLDGTTNYAHGFPMFCISIALLEGSGTGERRQAAGSLQNGLAAGGDVSSSELDRILLGVVYHPLLEELFVGERGKGSTLNGAPLHVSSTSSLQQALLATGFPYNVRENPDWHLGIFRDFILESQAIRRAGSAALDMCYVACGRFDGFWEVSLHPWDTAAGCRIVLEAGGTISTFRGDPYWIMEKSIVASNGHLHEGMVRVLSRHPPGPLHSGTTHDGGKR